MHVRLSSSKGLPVVEESSGEMVGFLSGILLDPDTGRVEGIYVRVPVFFGSTELFCSSNDILRWGMNISVRDREVISPVEERVRLLPLLEDNRTILGQKIRTESGAELGWCRDVQFDTGKMKLTWLFPKRWWRWGMAIPVSEVVEVRQDAVIVHDPPVLDKEREEALDPVEALERIQDIAEPGIVRPT